MSVVRAVRLDPVSQVVPVCETLPVMEAVRRSGLGGSLFERKVEQQMGNLRELCGRSSRLRNSSLR